MLLCGESDRLYERSELASTGGHEPLLHVNPCQPTTVMIEQMRKNAIGVVHRLERTGTLIPTGRDGHGATWAVA